MADKEQIKYDLDGYDILTNALLDLVNKYPDLGSEKIRFSSINTDGGIAIFPTSGAVVESEKRTITGKVIQICNYPFFIIYKVSGLSDANKIKVKDFLDKIGQWLEKQEVVIGTEVFKLAEYPALTEERKIVSINRVTPAYLESVEENKTENWAISMAIVYSHEYYK